MRGVGCKEAKGGHGGRCSVVLDPNTRGVRFCWGGGGGQQGFLLLLLLLLVFCWYFVAVFVVVVCCDFYCFCALEFSIKF